MFTKIIYINLDRRSDRDELMKKEFEKINWTGEIERISAVDGRQLELNSVKHLFNDHSFNQASSKQKIHFAPGSYMTRGAMGCALSHREALINIANGSHKKVLVLEDDISFDNNFNENLKKYLVHAPDYELLYIGYHESRGSQIVNEYYKKPNSVVFGLFGYIVDRKIANKLLERLFPLVQQIDSAILHVYPEIKVYHINEDLRLINSPDSLKSPLGTDIQIIEAFETPSNNSYFIIIVLIIILYFIVSVN